MSEPTRVVVPDFDFEERQTTCSSCQQPTTQKRLRVAGRTPPIDWIPARCDQCRARDDKEQAEAELRRKAVQAVDRLEVPRLYQAVTLEGFELHGTAADRERQARVVQLARRYLGLWPEVEPIVVFRGAPGTGKGHVAWSIVRELTRAHALKARVVKLPDLVRHLRAAWNSTLVGVQNAKGEWQEVPGSERAVLESYRRLELLVVDEVSRHAFYGEPRRHLYDLLDARLEWQRPTIVTSNEDPEGLADILGPALTSRVAGSSGLWDFGVDDYRLRASAQA